jgi:hypothetical protein
MWSQLLAGPPADRVLDAVERVVGIQAQSWSAARLAVRARTSGLTAADVDRALAGGELARTWLMRGTLHLVAAADLAWLTELFGPLNRAGGRRRREELGVPDTVAERALAEIPGILAGAGPMDRAELIAQLTRHGVRIDPTGQAPAHLVAFAASAGVLCRGPDLAGGRPSVILAEEVRAARTTGGPRRFEGDAALRELARRYVAGYGPLGPDPGPDLAAWSGLPIGTARRALDLLDPDSSPPHAVGGSSATATGRSPSPVGGSLPSDGSLPSAAGGSLPAGDGGSLPAAAGGSLPAGGGGSLPSAAGGSLPVGGGGSLPVVGGGFSPAGDVSPLVDGDGSSPGGPGLPPRLLGPFDAVLLGHRDRDFVLRPEHAKRVNAGGGMVSATLLLDGRVAGLWHRAGRKVVLQPFDGADALPAETRAALEAEVADLARFLDQPMTPTWE